MSSWRNLMTPANEKYQPQESTNSSLAHSKFLKTGSIKSTERESLRGSLYNEKMHSLQSEMSRLKNQLGKYSKKAVMNTESNYTPSESLAKRDYTNTVEGEEFITEQNEENNYENTEEQMHTDDYINLIPDYQYSEMAMSGGVNSRNHQEDDRENYGDYANRPSSRGERKRQSYKNHSRKSSGVDESRIMNIQDRNSNLRELKDQIRKHESGRKRRSSISQEPLRDMTNREMIEGVLYNCQNEIGELKDVVIDSRKKIEELQEELEREKFQTKMLRSEVQRTSVRQSKDENVYSRGSSPSSSKFDGLRNSRSFQEDQSQKLMMASRGSNNKFGSDYKIPPSTRGTSTQKVQKQLRTASTQCDFMLENIIDTHDDGEKDALREEVQSLREEVYQLKAQKNEMIETFQKIIENLATTKTSSSAKNENQVNAIKEDFKDFGTILENKLKEINLQNISYALNFSQITSPYKSPKAPFMATLEKTKTVAGGSANSKEKFDFRRHSKDEITSFYDHLADSRNTMQYTMQMDSPPAHDKKGKNILDSWKNHMNDLLSNDPKIINY